MLSYNLAERIHNKWKQQSGDCGLDLYVTTVDDFMRSFMQFVTYYEYLKEDRASTGPSKEELKLYGAQRSAERLRNSKSLHEALSKMPGAKEYPKASTRRTRSLPVVETESRRLNRL